jgi:hypothetical protein
MVASRWKLMSRGHDKPNMQCGKSVKIALDQTPSIKSGRMSAYPQKSLHLAIANGQKSLTY